MDWTGGLDWWTGLVDWTGGLDWWTGLVDWTGGLDWWTGLVDSVFFSFQYIFGKLIVANECYIECKICRWTCLLGTISYLRIMCNSLS